MGERLIRDGESAIVNADVVDGRRLLRGLGARKRWILGATLLSFGASLVFADAVHPRYMGVAKVLIENQESYFTKPDKATSDPALVIDDEVVQSQAEMFSTPDMARKAVDQLALATRTEFTSSGLGPLMTSLFGGMAASLFTSNPRATAEDRAVDAFLTKLTVFPVPKSRVLQVEFTSEDPALAARVPNLMAKLYLSSQQDAKKAEARSAAAWLSSRIEQLRTRVAEADSRLEAFRSKSGLMPIANGMTAPTQRLSEINSQIATARAAQSAASAKAQLLREMLRSGRLDDVPAVTGDESLRRFEETRVTLKSQLSELGRTLLPNHPRMRELAGQLQGLDEEMRVAAFKRVRGFEDEARLAGDQVRNLEAAVAEQAKAVAATDTDEVQLRALDSDAKAARDQLESYVGKYREAVARDGEDSGPANARVIETAVEPREPVFPKKAPTLLLGTLAGFLLSLGVAAASVLLAEDVAPALAGETKVSEPAQGPDLGFAADAPVAPSRAVSEERPPEPDLEVFDSETAPALATRWAMASPDGRLTLAITGEGARGALAVALATGRALSARGRTVLADLGQSQRWLIEIVESSEFEGAPSAGLADVIAGRASFESALHRDLSSQLDILPPGHGEIDAAELPQIFEALEASYPFVILHASDWRSACGAKALESATAVLVCGRAARLAGVVSRVREGLPDPVTLVEGVEISEESRAERAA